MYYFFLNFKIPLSLCNYLLDISTDLRLLKLQRDDSRNHFKLEKSLTLFSLLCLLACDEKETKAGSWRTMAPESETIQSR